MAVRKIPTALTALSLLAACNAALAQDQGNIARLDKASGTVMVDKGTGFVTAQGDARLKEGDRVITLDRSGAEIVFNDGCRATLKANNLMAINANPGCKAAIVAVNGAPGAGAGMGGSGLTTSQVAVPLLLAGGLVAATHHGHGNDHTPISAQ